VFKSYKSGHDIATCDVLICPPKNLFTWSFETHIVVSKLVEIFGGELLHFPLRALQLNYYNLNELMHKTVLDL
jgi:hypothetical protein